MPNALARRHRQSAAVARMMLTIVKLMHRDYHPKHPGAVLEELFIAWSVRDNDDAGGKPMTISSIAKKLNVPRSNVRHAMPALIRQGIICKVGQTYVGDINYLATRINADYFKAIRQAVWTAADALRK